MLDIVKGLRTLSTDIAAVFLCSCRAQQQFNSSIQDTLWRTRHHSTQAQERRKDLQSADARTQTDIGKLAAELKVTEPVLPTHRILKVVLQSEVPLTNLQLYEQVRAEFGAETFHTRRSFKNYLQQLQRRRWVKAIPPLRADSSTDRATKPGRKAAAKATDPYVYVGTPTGKKVDLNVHGTPLELAAREAADQWTKANLGQYEELMQSGKVPVTVDSLAIIPREKRRLFVRQLSSRRK